MDMLLQLVGSAKRWPVGSQARIAQTEILADRVAVRREEVGDLEDLLARQWDWCDRHEADGGERYQAKERILLTTLADYEDLVDGLHAAEAFLAGEGLRRVA